MTDEEYLRNRLDRLNQNSHYGIMIDTEITDIVRSHIKRLEETKMEPTSVWKIENIDKIWITQDGDEISLLLKNRDDLTKIILVGEAIKNHNDNFITTLKVDLEENEKEFSKQDQKIRDLEKELGEWKKEAADCLRLRDEVRREKNKEINKLKQQLQQAENDKRMYEDKIDDLQHKYNLEKAANEAQHKFIREYAGKGTEIQFNYAIDDAKEVSYAIVDKEENECKCESCSAGTSYEEMYRKLIDDLKKENKKLKEENFCVKSRINAFKNTNGKLRDEVLELKYQLRDIQATKEVVEQKLNTRAGILDQAKKCVCGQREQDYGTPESNFQLIADLWNDYLKKERLGRSKTVVDAVDVSMMMALMKIARIRNGGGSGDSFVDLAGYAACGGEIWHGQKVKDQN